MSKLDRDLAEARAEVVALKARLAMMREALERSCHGRMTGNPCPAPADWGSGLCPACSALAADVGHVFTEEYKVLKELEPRLKACSQLLRDIDQVGLRQGGEQYPNTLCCIDEAQRNDAVLDRLDAVRRKSSL